MAFKFQVKTIKSSAFQPIESCVLVFSLKLCILFYDSISLFFIDRRQKSNLCWWLHMLPRKIWRIQLLPTFTGCMLPWFDPLLPNGLHLWSSWWTVLEINIYHTCGRHCLSRRWVQVPSEKHLLQSVRGTVWMLSIWHGNLLPRSASLVISLMDPFCLMF